jgi:drug/metabolite transporter (DMT)-like permease
MLLLESRAVWNPNCTLTIVREGAAKDRRRIYLLAAGVVMSEAAGNGLLSVGLRSANLLSFSPLAYLREFANLAVLIGISALICRYILQLALLSWADLTYAMPVTSVSYGVIATIGVLVLGERVSITHWLGIALIIAGVVVVGRTQPLTTGLRKR